MKTRYLLIIGLLTMLFNCQTKVNEVIATEYDLDNTIKAKGVLQFHIAQTDSLIEYRLTEDNSKGDSSVSDIWFYKPTQTDSIIYLWDMVMKLSATKNYKIDGVENEVLKYVYKDGMDGDMTLFLNRAYGPIIVRNDFWKGMNTTYDRPMDKKRELIELIKNDSLDFGGYDK